MHVITMTAQGVMRLVQMTGHLHVIRVLVSIVTELVHATLASRRMETHIFLAKRTGESCRSPNLTLLKSFGTC